MPDTEERKRTAKDALLAVFACFAIAGCVYVVNKQPAGSVSRQYYYKTDVERAQTHYGITRAEYYRHPQEYPLPPRGTGRRLG